MSLESAISLSVDTVRQRLGQPPPRLAILLGSGWAGVAAAVEQAVDIPYADLPAFPQLAISGHAGLMRVGQLQGFPVIVLAGRKHAYESGEADAMKGVIRTLAGLGVRTLVQTNAAGSLDRHMQPGALMLISDHINLTQRSPLFAEQGNARFVGMSDAYDPALRQVARETASRLGQTLHEGVYAWMMGPQFETPAEIRMLGILGAQAVGMSTVPETILARHAGLRVMALSLITNLAAGLSHEALSHEHTLAVAKAGEEGATRFVLALMAGLAQAAD